MNIFKTTNNQPVERHDGILEAWLAECRRRPPQCRQARQSPPTAPWKKEKFQLSYSSCSIITQMSFTYQIIARTLHSAFPFQQSLVCFSFWSGKLFIQCWWPSWVCLSNRFCPQDGLHLMHLDSIYIVKNKISLIDCFYTFIPIQPKNLTFIFLSGSWLWNSIYY